MKVLARLTNMPVPVLSHHAARLGDIPEAFDSTPSGDPYIIDPELHPSGSTISFTGVGSTLTIHFDLSNFDYPPGYRVNVVRGNISSEFHTSFFLNVEVVVNNTAVRGFYSWYNYMGYRVLLHRTYLEHDPDGKTVTVWPTEHASVPPSSSSYSSSPPSSSPPPSSSWPPSST